MTWTLWTPLISECAAPGLRAPSIGRGTTGSAAGCTSTSPSCGEIWAHYHIPWGRDERRHWQEQSRPLQAGRAELRRRPGNRSCTRWKPDRTSLPVICRQCGTQGRWRALKTDCFRPGGVFIAASVVPISSFLWRIVGASRSKVKLHCCHGTNIHHLCDPFATNLYAICSPKRWRHLQTLR